MNNTTQLTIRGIDETTKDALVKQARAQGLSLNKYALQSLKKSAGLSSRDERYKSLKTFLSKNRISKEDMEGFDAAIEWSDRASKEKQLRDERETSI